MYLDFYGLRELPFKLTANPEYLYLTNGHREALGNLQYGMATAKAVTLLIGEAGTGKSTLLKAAMSSERCCHVRCVFLNNPTLTRVEFMEVLARSFNLGEPAARSKAVLLPALENALLQQRSTGEITALVIDEAQSLSLDLLEEVRLLANIETKAEKLLPVVLAGQPELAERLENNNLRQLKQRVALRCEVTAFELGETAGYIASRIRTAGGVAYRLFTREAVTLIHEYSRGIPRTINVICDNALTHGPALGRQPVDADMVLEVCRDFHLDAGQQEGQTVRSAATPGPDPVQDASIPASDESGGPKFRMFGGRRR